MNIASIDIGTNTAILLIVKADLSSGTFTPLLNEYRVPRVGKSVVAGSQFPEENVERLILVLKEYLEICANYKCEHIRAVATNAFRIASNSKQIVDLIEKNTELSIEVISGEVEASMTFSGAYNTTSNRTDKLLIDIGGGSTELIYGIPGQIKYRHSFPMGVVTFTEKYLNNSQAVNENIILTRQEILKQLQSENPGIPKGVETIAVAGTPTTLSCILQNQRKYHDELVDGSIIRTSVLHSIMDELKFLSPNEVKSKFGQVVDGREDILLAGVLILKTITGYFEINSITVSSRGLRYGIVIDLIASLQEKGRK